MDNLNNNNNINNLNNNNNNTDNLNNNNNTNSITNMKNKKVSTLGIIAIVFGGIGLFFSWMPIINNIAFIFAIIGLICGIIDLLKKPKIKKPVTIIGLILCIISIVIVIWVQYIIVTSLSDSKPNFSTNQQTTQNQKPQTKPSLQTKPASQTEYAIGQPYEKDVFIFKLSNPRIMDANLLENDKYLILDAEAVAKKDTLLGISISGVTDDGEIVNMDIMPLINDYKPFPIFENMQTGQKIKGQVAFKITDGKKIKKIRMQEAGKFITFNL